MPLTVITRLGARAALRVLPSGTGLALAKLLEREGDPVIVLRNGRVLCQHEGNADVTRDTVRPPRNQDDEPTGRHRKTA